MAVSMLPNWLHVALTFLLLPGEFYSFLLSASVPLVYFALPAHVQDDGTHFIMLLCRLTSCYRQFFTFYSNLLHTMF